MQNERPNEVSSSWKFQVEELYKEVTLSSNYEEQLASNISFRNTKIKVGGNRRGSKKRKISIEKLAFFFFTQVKLSNAQPSFSFSLFKVVFQQNGLREVDHFCLPFWIGTFVRELAD